MPKIVFSKCETVLLELDNDLLLQVNCWQYLSFGDFFISFLHWLASFYLEVLCTGLIFLKYS
jgi:hypothetical protein